ncbi:hypothetical protein ACH5RR_006562 [Cinchona calisaya]|uniref:Uncharacterized protein n=1 Tax=Cinchona calisaya TaxID=153742 RepID=A0ABD3APD1_9GENT
MSLVVCISRSIGPQFVGATPNSPNEIPSCNIDSSTVSNTMKKGGGPIRRLGLHKLNKATGSKLAIHIPLGKKRAVDRSQKNCLDGKEIDRVDFFKHTRYNETKGWVTPDVGTKYDEIIEIEKKSIEEDNSMSRDEIYDNAIKKRSAYIKGLGYSSKPSKSLSSMGNERNKILEELLQESQQECEKLQIRLSVAEANVDHLEMMLTWHKML